MKKSKSITEVTMALANNKPMPLSDNIVRDCKVLGWVSKNGRVYNKEIVGKALNKYENKPIYIDHPTREGPRKYEDKIGKLVNVRITEDGVFGDIIYNPKHHLADSFKWWVENDNDQIGLSHNISAKTKYDANGIEYIMDIDDVRSIDLVSEPGTTNGLFEHYNRKLRESDMDPMKDKEEDLVRKLDKGEKVKMEADDEEKKAPVADDEEKPMDGEEKKFKDMKEYGDYMKTKMMEIVGDDEKVMKLMELMDLHDKPEMESSDMDDMLEADKKDDEEDKEKVEESFRGAKNVHLKNLMEELDSYRAADRKAKLVAEAKEYSEKAGLPASTITETFINLLIGVNKDGWKSVVEDRAKLLNQTKAPISTGMVEKKLSVDDFVKYLTQE